MPKHRRIKNFVKVSNESSSHGASFPNLTSSRHPQEEVGSSHRGAKASVQPHNQTSLQSTQQRVEEVRSSHRGAKVSVQPHNQTSLQSTQQRIVRSTRVAHTTQVVSAPNDQTHAPHGSQNESPTLVAASISSKIPNQTRLQREANAPVQPPNQTSSQHESNVPVQPPNLTSSQHEANVPVQPPNLTSQSAQPMAARPRRRVGRASTHYWSVDALDEENDAIRKLHLMVKDINNLPDGLRVIVDFDDQHSPIGEAAGLLSGVCGLLATHSPFFPISLDKWSDMPADYFETQWKDLFERRFCFNEVEDLAKRYIEGSIGKKWREYRLKLFDDNFDPTLSKNEIVNNKPKDVPLDHWVKFVEYRLKPETMEMCKRNKEVRKKQIFPHTCGAMTFARKRHILTLEAGKPVGRGPMWDMTHKNADGKYVNEEAKKIGEKICNHIAENPDAYSEISPNDVVGKIFGKEHSGRVRGMGMGVVPTLAFKRTTTRLSGMEFGSSRGSTSSGSSSLVNQKLATMEAQMTALVGYIKAKEGGSLPAELAAALFPNDTPLASNVGSESSTPNDITRSSDASNAHGES